MATVSLCAGCGREITDGQEQSSLCAECENKIHASDPTWQPNAASKAASTTMEACND